MANFIIGINEGSLSTYCSNCVENCPQNALIYTKDYEYASCDKEFFGKVYE